VRRNGIIQEISRKNTRRGGFLLFALDSKGDAEIFAKGEEGTKMGTLTDRSKRMEKRG